MGIFDKMNFEVKKGVFVSSKKPQEKTTSQGLKRLVEWKI